MFKFNTYLERPFFKLNGVKIGRRVRMIGWPCIFRFPGSEIEIGDDCLIRSNFWSNLIGLYQRTIIIAKRGAKIKIGKNVGISGSTIYAWNGICIGDNTLIGANCKILDTDLHPIDVEARNTNNWDEVKTAPVVIGRDCFIGCNSLILKGVTLGDGCVIGAGSVVTKDVPPLCVAAGNPAKVVRKLTPGSAADPEKGTRSRE
ncbi:MAG: acyltransferase [Oscillospiraceae bacterium]|nr:acyltransferase [Oscillospiraceae bacterium]